MVEEVDDGGRARAEHDVADDGHVRTPVRLGLDQRLISGLGDELLVEARVGDAELFGVVDGTLLLVDQPAQRRGGRTARARPHSGTVA
jgi:hypothetical protein